MMAWKIGSEQGYRFSLGKNDKFIDRYLPKEDWEKLLSTYAQSGYQEMWQSLFAGCELFRKYSKAVAEHFGYSYPDYDEAITKYTNQIYASLT
jgi:aminoglycoside 6-adenylyltransferase